MSINKVEISGNLTRDAETKTTQSGGHVITFGVAVNDRRQNPQTGQWEDYPNFVDCVLFDRNGNKQWIANALRKGFKVFLEGSLRYSSWEKDGQRRSKLEVVVRDIDANWPKKDQTQGYQPQQYAQQPPRQYQQQGYAQQQTPQGYAPAPQQGYSPQAQPQGYPQPASAPQQPQPATYPQQQQYAPQPAPQAASPAPQQPTPQQMQMAAQPQPDVYDDDIPF